MWSRRLRSVTTDTRGIALPLALILLTVLMSLTLAFLTMGGSEPTIAANLKSGEMALAAAEAGVERAIWALSNPTVDTAGAGTKLTDLTNIPAPYKTGTATLFALGGSRAFTVTITRAAAAPNDITLRGDGYVVRNGVTLPGLPTGLAQSDIVGHRVVELKLSGTGSGNKVGGAGAGSSGGDVKLPGALTVAGSVQMRGNSIVDGNDLAAGTPNSCAQKGGVTIRDKTQIADNQCASPPCWTDNSVTFNGNAYTLLGTPPQQTLPFDTFSPYTFNAAQLSALKALAQANGTYIQPTSSSEIQLTIGNGLTFVDTVNGQSIGQFPTSSQLASVAITGNQSANGWLIVMGSIRIDGNITYNGFIYAHNDLSYRGTGTGGIYGGVLTGNVIDTVATLVDTQTEGNSKIYYDCNKIANGGGGLPGDVQNGLNRTIVNIIAGTWKEISN
jgi:Tfp pilus assembly protein PilX